MVAIIVRDKILQILSVFNMAIMGNKHNDLGHLDPLILGNLL